MAANRAGMKALTLVLSIPITKAITAAVEKVWRTARPGNPSTDVHDPSANAGDAIGYAALTAAGVVAAQLLTRKATEQAYRKATGLEPPPPPPTKEQKKALKAEAKAAKKARSK